MGNRGVVTKGGARKQLTPKQVAAQKKRISNPNKSVSTERTITVSTGKEFKNIPTIRGGKQLTPKRAIAAAKQDKIQRPSFSSIERAEKAATRRSKNIGKAIRRRK